jgi:hypothetical protein
MLTIACMTCIASAYMIVRGGAPTPGTYPYACIRPCMHTAPGVKWPYHEHTHITTTPCSVWACEPPHMTVNVVHRGTRRIKLLPCTLCIALYMRHGHDTQDTLHLSKVHAVHDTTYVRAIHLYITRLHAGTNPDVYMTTLKVHAVHDTTYVRAIHSYITRLHAGTNPDVYMTTLMPAVPYT